MIPAGSRHFIRLHIFLPKGFSSFGTAFQDFAIRLEIWGCRGAIIHTVSRRWSRNVRELCAALSICHLDGVMDTWADFQGPTTKGSVLKGREPPFFAGGLAVPRCPGDAPVGVVSLAPVSRRAQNSRGNQIATGDRPGRTFA